jgi:hypothetical protein
MIKNITAWFTTFFLLAWTTIAAEGPRAEVSGVIGVATAQVPGGPEEPLRPGMQLVEGAILRSASRAAADLHLGGELGVIRLTQNTMVTIEKLGSSNTGSEAYLHLQHGTILGNGATIRAGSRYQIKTAVGIAAIGNAAFRLHSEGYFVVVEGKAQFAHVPVGGDAQVHALSAPPAVYFSPSEGIKEAPKPLVKEIVTQSKARLSSGKPPD